MARRRHQVAAATAIQSCGRHGRHYSGTGDWGQSPLPIHVDLRSSLGELAGFLSHADFERVLFRQLLFGGELSNIFGYLHRAEVRATHGTEVCSLGAFLRQSFVVKLAGGFGIEREIKLVLPTELEPGFRNRVVAILGAGMAFR